MEDGNSEIGKGSVRFADIGVVPVLCERLDTLGYARPTLIQTEAIPHSLKGRDVIGVAETGSGKTAAFCLPILQALLETPKPFFAVILSPTRELAIQISEQIDEIGACIHVVTSVLVGGVDMMTQAVSLSKRPHVIVCTPGRLVDHIENTRGFSLRNLKYLVLDEADRLLDLNFGREIDKILQFVPKERTTMLFSATMTTRVEKLQKASLKDPVKVEIGAKHGTVAQLIQNYAFIPLKHKDTYFVFILNEFSGNSVIVFVNACNTAHRLSYMLRNLGFDAIPLHGKMAQPQRIGALESFRTGNRKILVATDVVGRGIDVGVDLVVNYNISDSSKDYIHRVGRTARAGKSGRAITLVTQYDIELYQRIEEMLEMKLQPYQMDKASALSINERVEEAKRIAKGQMRELEEKTKRKTEFDEDKENTKKPRT